MRLVAERPAVRSPAVSYCRHMPGKQLARDESSVVGALRSGDESAFRELHRLYDQSLRRVARSYVASDEAAEDVVQETWLGVVRGIHRFEGRSSVKNWVFAILINSAKSRGVIDKRSEPFSALLDDPSPSVPTDRFHPPGHRREGYWTTSLAPWASCPELRAESAEVRGLLGAAVKALPPTQQAVLTLRDVHSLTSAEVCELLAISEVNQRVLLHRARSKVRAALETYVEAGGAR